MEPVAVIILFLLTEEAKTADRSSFAKTAKPQKSVSKTAKPQKI